MKIIVILRNIYNSFDFFDDEQYLCKSDCNVIAEAMMLKEALHESVEITALLFAEKNQDNIKTLKKASTYGVDKSILIEFQKFDFSDTKRFSQIIATTIKRMNTKPNLILFGRLACDGDAVNLATQTACQLQWPRIVYSKEIFVANEQLYSKKYICSSEEIIYQLDMKQVVIQSIRKHGVTRQPKITDIVRAYNNFEIEYVDGDMIASGILEKQKGFLLTQKTEPKEAVNKKLLSLNDINDEATAKKLLELLQKKGFRK